MAESSPIEVENIVGKEKNSQTVSPFLIMFLKEFYSRQTKTQVGMGKKLTGIFKNKVSNKKTYDKFMGEI